MFNRSLTNVTPRPHQKPLNRLKISAGQYRIILIQYLINIKEKIYFAGYVHE